MRARVARARVLLPHGLPPRCSRSYRSAEAERRRETAAELQSKWALLAQLEEKEYLASLQPARVGGETLKAFIRVPAKLE